MWEAIGTVAASVIALFFGVYPIWKDRNNRPQIKLEFDPSYIRRDRENVHFYYFKINNKGPVTAYNVTIRLIEAVQGEKHFEIPHERYHLFRTEKIQNGDYWITNLFHNHLDKNYFLTPAGSDKQFQRIKTKLTLLVSGDNFPSYTKKIVIIPVEGSKDLEIKI